MSDHVKFIEIADDSSFNGVAFINIGEINSFIKEGDKYIIFFRTASGRAERAEIPVSTYRKLMKFSI